MEPCTFDGARISEQPVEAKFCSGAGRERHFCEAQVTHQNSIINVEAETGANGNIIEGDLLTCKGVVHVLSGVLVPLGFLGPS